MRASVGGVVVVLVLVLVLAGSLLMVGYSFANDDVHTRMAEQQIAVPASGSVAARPTRS